MDLVKRMCNEIYFLKGKGLLGFLIFIASYVFVTALGGVGIALFVLPVCYVISIFMLWIGLEAFSNNVVFFGLLVTAISANLFSVLYFAETNVRIYKERLQAVDDLKENN